MRRLLFFILGFVLAFAMLINMGCATVQKTPLGIMKELKNELKIQAPQDSRKVGWVAIDKDGYRWEYHAKAKYNNTQVLATCTYTYMRISGVERWKGTYHGTSTDFYWKDPPVARLDNLVGCFNWVNHHMNGNHFI